MARKDGVKSKYLKYLVRIIESSKRNTVINRN